MTTWLNLTLVAAGGAVGSVARYLITTGSVALPWGSTMLGTTIANLIGCAAIGGFTQYAVATEHVSPATQLAVRVGLLGGLTTFSTFAFESAALAESGRWAVSGIYVLANLMLGWLVLVLAATAVRGWMS
jgi:CrcB protein